jgi:hypothetical protein
MVAHLLPPVRRAVIEPHIEKSFNGIRGMVPDGSAKTGN